MLKRTLPTVLAWILAVSLASAVEVPLRDGSVIQASAYRVNGSYVVVTMPGGRQVAYDVGDVDLAKLRADEAARAPEAVAEPSPAPVVGLARAKAKSSGTSKLKIMDRDVEHVTSQVSAATGEKQKAESGQKIGGAVAIQGMRIVAAGPSLWQVRGQVVNGGKTAALSVRVELQAFSASREKLGAATLSVSGSLAPGRSAPFAQSFAAPSKPVVRARVLWTQPAAPAKPAAAPAAPAQGGSAGAAKPKPTPVGPMSWGGSQIMKVAPVTSPTPRPKW